MATADPPRMPIDPFSPRILASAFALAGLGTMMIAPEPNWHSAGIGLACLLAFTGLSLVPSAKPGARDGRARTGTTQGRTKRGAHAAAEQVERPPEPAPVAPRGLNDPHPALFRGMQTRQSRVSD